MSSQTITTVEADFSSAAHATAILALLDSYARDPMGGGEPLAPAVRQNLIAALGARADALAVLVYAGETPAALAIAFEGFSTFQCKPLLNIHDIVVAPPFRGRGLSQRLLEKLEALARMRGCCKLTLEVLEGNRVAQGAYRKFGFSGYELDPTVGKALFWEKKL